MDPFFQQPHALVQIGTEGTRGEEAERIIDHDRCLANLLRIVERLRERVVGRLFADDDLDEGHPVDGREEVDADEVLGFAARFGEPRDRQRGGVGTPCASLGEIALELFRDLVLQLHVLEDRFDDEVTAGEVFVHGRGLDPRQHGLGFFRRHAASHDALVQELLRVAFAFLRGFEGNVLEDHFDARHRGDVGNALTHHPGTQHTDFLRFLRGHVRGPARAAVDLVQAEEKRADHVLRLGRQRECRQTARFDAQRGLEIEPEGLHGNIEDLLRSGQETAGLLQQHRRPAGDSLLDLRRCDTSAGNTVVRAIPGLCGGIGILAMRLDPFLRAGHEAVDLRNEVVDQPGIEGRDGIEALAFEQERKRRLEAQQLGHAYHATATWQQTEGDFGKTELNAAVIPRDSMIAREADLESAAEGGAVDRGHDGDRQFLEA